ncbi:MAG: hypothetical protein H0V17_11505 [Deltaproteobacteria bacterium]|nr:hypothetical protein [Deltaproteobacteria bacterium]
MLPTLCSCCLTKPLATDRETYLKMCNGCADQYGVVPMPRSRRPPVPCRGCNGLHFVRAVPRELTNKSNSTITSPEIAPMTVTYAYRAPATTWLGTHAAQPLDAKLGFGTLEMFICKSCGLVDWFCQDPEQIPIGPSYMTEDVDYESETGPYR